MKTKSSVSTILLAAALTSSAAAATTAYWRMEEATSGAVSAAQDSSGNGFNQTGSAGSPVYSTNIPGPSIFDPVAGTTVPNTASLDATAANSQIRTVNNAAFNTSFTLEMFIQITGEPGGYHSFARRNEGNTSRWQIDFDHAGTSAFGRGRVRFDTPDGDNTNFVAGPTGGANVPGSERLWVDTPTGDGLVSSYVSADWAADGDSVNDNLSWRHVAITFDQGTQELSYYTDYALSQSRILIDSDMSGYVHPNARFDFGKLTNSAYGLAFDEIRYSDTVLDETQFLQAVPEPGSAALAIIAACGLLLRRRR